MLTTVFLEQGVVFEILLGAAFATVIGVLGLVGAYFHRKAQLSRLALFGVRITEGIDEEVKAIRLGLQPTIARVEADGVVTQLERQEVLAEVVRLVKVRFGQRMLSLAMKASGVSGLGLDQWLGQKVAPVLATHGVLPVLAAAAQQVSIAKETNLSKVLGEISPGPLQHLPPTPR